LRLIAGLRGREAELDEAIFTRLRGEGADGWDQSEYVAGLRTAVSAAIEHAFAVMERSEASCAIPPQTIAQARRAARVSVSLDTVLRRYVIGSTLMGDFLVQEAARQSGGQAMTVVREMLGTQATVLDGLLQAVIVEYNRERERAAQSAEWHRAQRIRALLISGDTSASEFGYDLHAHHTALIAAGKRPELLLYRLASELRCPLLCVNPDQDSAWGWLSHKDELTSQTLERLAQEHTDLTLALGEPAPGLAGWRLSHRQAQAAQAVALQQKSTLARYRDVALLAAMLNDPALAASMVEIYLSPLGSNHNGGAHLRQTLRAYFKAERNVSSAASALGVARHTVSKRLRAIEERLGQPLSSRQAELEVALRLEEMGERNRPSR
jgi:hypothetical protein